MTLTEKLALLERRRTQGGWAQQINWPLRIVPDAEKHLRNGFAVDPIEHARCFATPLALVPECTEASANATLLAAAYLLPQLATALSDAIEILEHIDDGEPPMAITDCAAEYRALLRELDERLGDVK